MMKAFGVAFTIITYSVISMNANEVEDLSGNKWVLHSDTLNITVPAIIPGNVHMDLLRNGIISDPYYEEGDKKFAWVAEYNWTYVTRISCFKDLSNFTSIRLTMYGVDTVSNIFFNGELIGKTNNMFTQYSFELVNHLQKENTLAIKFVSPTYYAETKYKEYLQARGYKVPPVELPEVQHGRNHQNFIRKEQCSFSWDWGPSFPTVGIWKDIQLEYVQLARIEHILIHTVYSKETRHWVVYFEAVIESNVERDVIATFGFNNNFKERKIYLYPESQKIKLGSLQIEDHLAELWWPRGYGKQILYDAHVRLYDIGALQSTSKNVKFGFREVKLVQDPIKGGLTFYFTVNSKAIFLKGSNWIPADSFQDRVTETILEKLLNDTVEANMNALRVWGGGIYEQDEFYNLADRLGIMIWQDLMFAVALYPVDRKFLESVRKEVQYQVHRLQHHPSVIIWSGNNENEAAIVQEWWPEVTTDKVQYIADYKKLYVDLLKEIIEEEDWSHPFILSSPSNGKLSDKEIISENPQSEFYGDVHYYNYNGNCWNASMFPVPRFASEYGYQSYPSYITLSQASSPNQLVWNSSLMFSRQHHQNGNKEIENFIKMNFNLPSKNMHPNDYFKNMIYLSQIVQALCIKYETEHYRRWQGRIDRDGKGHTMGALYWQLNDIWQAPSWSSIEYGGRWKILHYYVKQFFNAAAVSGYLNNDILYVYAVSDNPILLPPLSVQFSIHEWSSFKRLHHEVVNVKEMNESVLVFHSEVMHFCPQKNCFVELNLYHRGTGLIISKTHVFLQPFNQVTLQDPQLKIESVTQVSEESFEIMVTSTLPAAFVWLETAVSGHFSNNGFVMALGGSIVRFDCEELIELSQLQRSLKVQSLYDVYRTKKRMKELD